MHQLLLLLAGQFRSDGISDPEGKGVQTLFSQQAGRVYYGVSNDWTPPTFAPVELLRVGGTLGFAVDVTDSGGNNQVKRVLALYRDCDGSWKRAELAKAAAGNRWSGGGATTGTCNDLAYMLQAVDGAGNVGVHWRKLERTSVLPPTPNQGSITATTNVPPHSSGWYTSATVAVTLELQRERGRSSTASTATPT